MDLRSRADTIMYVHDTWVIDIWCSVSYICAWVEVVIPASTNPSELWTDPLHQVASVPIFRFLILNCREIAKQSAYSFAAISLDIEIVLQHGGRPYDVTARGLYARDVTAVASWYRDLEFVLARSISLVPFPVISWTTWQLLRWRTPTSLTW